MIFSEQHHQLQQTVKSFVDSEINPHVEQWENAGIFPAKTLFPKLGELGLLGITKPEQFGGLGLDYSYQIAFAETLSLIHI